MIALLLALCLALVPGSASADERGPSAGAAPAATPAAAPAPTAQQLVQGSLGQDIATASYYELVAWCDQLGLDDSGARTDLQQRIAKHYGVTLPPATAAGQRTITVRSARQTEYYTSKDVDERYVILRGDVEIEVRDSSDGTVQDIKAASITYNQTKRTMSAEGGVTYALTRGGQTDTFTGQSLAFNLDTSEAVFYDGKTTRKVTRSSGEVPYTFSGETMTRLSNDTVILENGSLTSSDLAVDPLYQVHAQTVWLLTPGEWALQNALLMIGRVPILYIPGLFWPGDDFFFNPNIGYKTREGSFLQTTTYLIGHKPKEENALSFLQLSDSGTAGYTLERHGMFLRKVTDNAAPKDSSQYMKLMLDAYSRLGLFAGLAGDFSPLSTFKAGIGVTRSIFYDGTTGYYTPYLPLPAPGYSVGDQFWNSSSLFGLSVPFRYGMEGTLKSSGSSYDVSASFQFFSDPSFTSDFYTRSEAGFLNGLLASQISSNTTTTAAQQTNLSWDLTSHFDFAKLLALPYVQTFAISNLAAKVTWLSNTISAVTDPQASDPGSTFFYPSSITFPNIALSFAGDLLSLGTGAQAAAGTTATGAASTTGSTPAAGTTPTTGTKPATGTTPATGTAQSPGSTTATAPTSAQDRKKAQPTKDPGKGFRAPVAIVTPTPAAASTVQIRFREPAPQPVSTAQQESQGSTLKLSYQVQPRATLEHTFDTTNWTTKDAVDYTIKYRTLETGGSGSLTASTSLLDKFADLSVGLSTDGLWRSRFNPSAAESSSTEWDSLLLSDLQADEFALRTAIQGTIHPLSAIDVLSASTLQYKLGLRLFQIAYTGTDIVNPVFTSTALDWNSDSVSEHSLQSALVLNTPLTSDTLALTAQLPPLVPTYTARLDLGLGVVKGAAQLGYSIPTTGVVYQPFVLQTGIDFGSNFGASEELQYDIANSVLTKSTSQLNLGNFTGSFIAQNTTTAGALLPSAIRVGYEDVGTPAWYWNDRIKMSLSVKSHWYLNMQSYIDNLFDFSLDLNFSIYKFFDLTFSSLSTNTKTYRYVPAWAASVGDVWVNPLTDLLESFNFFDGPSQAGRTDSAFKIKTLAVKAVQHLPDWDLSFTYDGSVQLRTNTTTGTLSYQWTPTFTIQVTWNAVSEIKSNITGDYTGISLRGASTTSTTP